MPRLTTEEQKQRAAAAALVFVENRMTIGLGTGSTTAHFLQLLSRAIKAGLQVTGVPSSLATARLAKRLRIPLVEDSEQFGRIDLMVDGADEVDTDLNLIKGGGGALTREKILATRSDRVVIIVNERKMVGELGRFRLPVEVLPFGWQSTKEMLRQLGARVSMRKVNGKPALTDNRHYLLDCAFGRIADPDGLEFAIKRIAGVVEAGLFCGIADLVLSVGRDGEVNEHWAT